MLLVVHAASPVHVLPSVCLVVIRDLLIVLAPRARGRRRSCSRCLLILFLVIVLDRADCLLGLRISVINELGQELEESVVAAPAHEGGQDVAVLLVLQTQLKELHDRNPELILQSVRQVVIAHDRLLHCNEDVDQAWNHVLPERLLIEFVHPRRECRAEPVQDLHCTAAQRRVTNMLVRSHDHTERSQHRHRVQVDEEPRDHVVCSLLPVPVKIQQIKGILQDGAGASMPESAWRRRRECLAGPGSGVLEEVEGEVYQVPEALQENRLLQGRLGDKELAPSNVGIVPVLLHQVSRDVLHTVEGLLDHRQQKHPDALCRQPEDLILEVRLVPDSCGKARIRFRDLEGGLKLLCLAEARLVL
mmetsp:Transcript_53399/g.173683  ORF Transcript_53399/g.173683 Transcript_53399/m.173683 type:complete len:360 (+) Transcript_53399:750-1829(+)